jgi:hypothetical protein
MLEKIKTFLGDTNIEVQTSQGNFTLCKADEIEDFELKIYSLDLDSEGEYITPLSEDPNENGIYTAKAINLVKSSEHYDPLGLLLYIPKLNAVGAWDSSHYQLLMFTHKTWEEIEANIAYFIEAQWESIDGYSIYEVFEPWKHWEFTPNKV